MQLCKRRGLQKFLSWAPNWLVTCSKCSIRTKHLSLHLISSKIFSYTVWKTILFAAQLFCKICRNNLYGNCPLKSEENISRLLGLNSWYLSVGITVVLQCCHYCHSRGRKIGTYDTLRMRSSNYYTLYLRLISKLNMQHLHYFKSELLAEHDFNLSTVWQEKSIGAIRAEKYIH